MEKKNFQQRNIKTSDGLKDNKSKNMKSKNSSEKWKEDPKESSNNSITSRTNIEVVVRIRPENEAEQNNPKHRTIVESLSDKLLLFDPKQEKEEFYYHGKKVHGRHDFNKRPNKDQTFAFDRVFGPESSNKEIFDISLVKIVDHIIEGFNCSVFAYGATGAGKTFSMLGTNENPGLSFYISMELFNRMGQFVNEYEPELVVSYMEIYNEKIRDLLEPSGSLSIREDVFCGIQIPNLTTHKPKDAKELLYMLRYGNELRTQHPTDRNEESSRSHAIFQVLISLREKYSNPITMRKSKLVMVDLAGSEKGGASNCEDARFREGANINKSLFALGNCINALADGKKHVPYRDSKLTRILKDSLGGNCKTVMIANLSPSNLCHDDSYNTLKYADRAKEIRVQLKPNLLRLSKDINNPTYRNHLTELKDQITSLTKQLKREQKASEKLKLELEQRPFTSAIIFRPESAVKESSECEDQYSPLCNPIALENFILLLDKKKQLDINHVSASTSAREAEWDLRWKDWRILGATSMGKASKSLYVSLNKWKKQSETLKLQEVGYRGRALLTKTTLDFNEKQIDSQIKQYIKGVLLDHPFITVTLKEFMHYKSLEKELLIHTHLENHHRRTSLRIFGELMKDQKLLWKVLRFQKTLYKLIQGTKKCTKEIDETHADIMAMVYGLKSRGTASGCKSAKSSSRPDSTKDFPTDHTIHSMFELIRSPVVDYDPPTQDNSSSENENENARNSDRDYDRLVLVETSRSNQYRLKRSGSQSSINTEFSDEEENEEEISSGERKKIFQMKYEKKIQEVVEKLYAIPAESDKSLKTLLKGTDIKYTSKNLETELMNINPNFKPKKKIETPDEKSHQGSSSGNKGRKKSPHVSAIKKRTRVKSPVHFSPLSRTPSEKSKRLQTKPGPSSAKLPLSLKESTSNNNNNTSEQFSEAFSSSESNTSIYSLTSIGSGGLEYYASLPTLSSAPKQFQSDYNGEKTRPVTAHRRGKSTPPRFEYNHSMNFKRAQTTDSEEKLYNSDCSFISSKNETPVVSGRNKNGNGSNKSYRNNSSRNLRERKNSIDKSQKTSEETRSRKESRTSFANAR